MEVVTDAVPSPARPEQTSCEPSEDLKPNTQPEQILNNAIPDQSSRAQDQNKTSESNLDSSMKSRSFPTAQYQDRPKCNTKKKSRTTQSSSAININGCHNVFLGKVNNFYTNINKTNSTKCDHDHATLSGDMKKMLKKLQNSPKTVDEDDIILVSECVDMQGLKLLVRKLGIEEVELNKRIDMHGPKGLSDIAFQTLQLWTDLSRRGEHQSAMLNILCESLCLIYDNGGKQALEGLYKRHFPCDDGKNKPF